MIRLAKTKDVKALTRLARETYITAFGDSMAAAELGVYLATHLSEERIETFIREDVVLVVAGETRLIGYVHFGDVTLSVKTPASQSKEIRRLYVLPEFQKQGIGSVLLEAALEHPLLQGATYIYLDVWEKNLGAIRLYKRFGFTVIDQVRFILPSGVEADLDYIMVRRCIEDRGVQ